MNDKIMAEEVKPETKVAFANRKYSNEDKRKMEEEELEQLIAEQKGGTTEATEEVVEAEPANAEEKSFKKRYGDLRRHMQDKEKDWDDKLATIQRQLEESTKQEIKLPKSDDDIEAWAKQYPDVAAIVETIAIKKAREQAAGLEERVKEIDEMKADATRKKAEVELMTAHPDFGEIRDDDSFHEWVDEQPKWVQDALYENASDSRSAARAIDLYKADMGINTKKPASNNKDAARSVNSRSNATPDSEDSKNVFKESQVNKMSAQQYEKASDAIMESIRTGKFIYDMSGNAR
tara:strand:+ start:49 stop:921 length:873 start_codon:yes stop_codon:yes gene_type:complete